MLFYADRILKNHEYFNVYTDFYKNHTYNWTMSLGDFLSQIQ